ncbi:MAG: hypothetical protein MK082_11155 [Phycisphaerales bacterium]|nr:hypothetical protein [Phycisphaerales bacterium]
MTAQANMICPYCGSNEHSGNVCTACGGLLDPASRAATSQDIGPWFVRSVDRPFFPGCTHERLRRMIRDGHVTRETIIRGPTTGGFWLLAGQVPGIARLLGFCHGCSGMVGQDDMACPRCGVPLGLEHQLPGGMRSVETSPADSAVELIKHAQYKQIGRLQSYVRMQAIGLAVCFGIIIVGLMLYATGLLDAPATAPVAAEEASSATAPAVPTEPAVSTLADEVDGGEPDPPVEPIAPAGPSDPVPVPRGEVVTTAPPLDPVEAAQQKLMEQLHSVTPDQAALINRLGELMEVSAISDAPRTERIEAIDEACDLIDQALPQEEEGSFMRLRLEALRAIFEKDRRRIELESMPEE